MASVVTMPKGRYKFVSNPLFRAFAVSLCLHVAIFAGTLIPALAVFKKTQFQLSEKKQVDQALPLDFIQVETQKPAAETPKNAKFYGAVNVEPVNAITPTKPAPQPLKPVVAPPAPSPPKVEPKPLSQPKPTDLARAKEPSKKKEDLPKPAPAPLVPVVPVVAKPVEQPQPEPNAKRRELVSTPAVKSSLAGGYDQQFIETVNRQWDRLLDQMRSSSKPGKVVLDFNMSHDGRISNMVVRETTVDEMQTMLCKKAVWDPAPYPRWTPELRKELKQDVRGVTFTFIYSE